MKFFHKNKQTRFLGTTLLQILPFNIAKLVSLFCHRALCLPILYCYVKLFSLLLKMSYFSYYCSLILSKLLGTEISISIQVFLKLKFSNRVPLYLYNVKTGTTWYLGIIKIYTTVHNRCFVLKKVIYFSKHLYNSRRITGNSFYWEVVISLRFRIISNNARCSQLQVKTLLFFCWKNTRAHGRTRKKCFELANFFELNFS